MNLNIKKKQKGTRSKRIDSAGNMTDSWNYLIFFRKKFELMVFKE